MSHMYVKNIVHSKIIVSLLNPFFGEKKKLKKQLDLQVCFATCTALVGIRGRMQSERSIVNMPFPFCCPKEGNSFGSSVNIEDDMSDCTSTISSRFDVCDFDNLSIGERDVTSNADLVGVGGAGRIGRERLGCTGITQGPRSLKAVAKLPPVPPRCSLLELSAIMMRDSGKERNLELDFFSA